LAPSIGWVEVVGSGKEYGTNCLLVWNGVEVPEHLFRGMNTCKCTFFFPGGKSWSDVRQNSHVIGNDTLLFKRNQVMEGVRAIKTDFPVEGEKIQMLSYSTKEDAIQGASRLSVDQGSIVKIDAKPPTIGPEGAPKYVEKAYYNVSSSDGHCGAPVINTKGHVVGFHNFTMGNLMTGFIPVLEHTVHLAIPNASRAKDFQLPHPQAS
jgi:hypothetical protein